MGGLFGKAGLDADGLRIEGEQAVVVQEAAPVGRVAPVEELRPEGEIPLPVTGGEAPAGGMFLSFLIANRCIGRPLSQKLPSLSFWEKRRASLAEGGFLPGGLPAFQPEEEA